MEAWRGATTPTPGGKPYTGRAISAHHQLNGPGLLVGTRPKTQCRWRPCWCCWCPALLPCSTLSLSEDCITGGFQAGGVGARRSTKVRQGSVQGCRAICWSVKPRPLWDDRARRGAAAAFAGFELGQAGSSWVRRACWVLAGLRAGRQQHAMASAGRGHYQTADIDAQCIEDEKRTLRPFSLHFGVSAEIGRLRMVVSHNPTASRMQNPDYQRWPASRVARCTAKGGG